MPNLRPSRPTMDDVAVHAGVSQMTVSRVMRGTGYISDDVRDRVTAAARELGYVQNRLANALRDDRTPLVAVVLPTLGNRVFNDVLAGANDALTAGDLRPVFGVTEYSQEREASLVTDLLSWLPTGIILPGLEHAEATRDAIARSGIRTVEIMDIDGDPIATAIGLSHGAAGRTMARHMLSKGYRRFACIGAQQGRDLRARKRFSGFADTVREAGARLVGEPRLDGASSMLHGRQMTAEMLAGDEAPDAIFYANDDLAAGGLMHCLAEGISVPERVALAGFNGLAFLDALPLQLTTIETPRHEMGYQAALLVSGGEEEGPSRRDLGFRLIEGDTC